MTQVVAGSSLDQHIDNTDVLGDPHLFRTLPPSPPDRRSRSTDEFQGGPPS